MEKWEKLNGKMEKYLMEKWTEIEKINTGCFLSGEDMLFTHPTFYQLWVQVYMVEDVALVLIRTGHTLGALASGTVNEVSCVSLYHYTHRENTTVSYLSKL